MKVLRLISKELTRGLFPETPQTANMNLQGYHSHFPMVNSMEKVIKPSTPRYVAVHNEVKGNNVEFNNECVWTAEFDWTLILSGEFQITSTSTELILERKMGDITDLYKLKRK